MISPVEFTMLFAVLVVLELLMDLPLRQVFGLLPILRQEMVRVI